jgi:hypothetical protein
MTDRCEELAKEIWIECVDCVNASDDIFENLEWWRTDTVGTWTNKLREFEQEILAGAARHTCPECKEEGGITWGRVECKHGWTSRIRRGPK